MSDPTKFITIIRPQFMDFCQDACRSALLNHLLFRIAWKAKDATKEQIQACEITWYATGGQITKEISNAWGVSKINKEVNNLIDMGLIGRTGNQQWKVDRTKHFFFGPKECEKFVQSCEEHGTCIVHLDICPEVRHLLYSSNAIGTSIKCICANQQMHSVDSTNAFVTSTETIPKEGLQRGTTKEGLQKKEAEVVVEETGIVAENPPPPSILSSGVETHETQEKPEEREKLSTMILRAEQIANFISSASRLANIQGVELLHAAYPTLTLEQFEYCFNDWNTFQTTRGKPPITIGFLLGKQSTDGMIRLEASLMRWEAEQRRAQIHVVSSSPNAVDETDGVASLLKSFPHLNLISASKPAKRGSL